MEPEALLCLLTTTGIPYNQLSTCHSVTSTAALGLEALEPPASQCVLQLLEGPDDGAGRTQKN